MVIRTSAETSVTVVIPCHNGMPYLPEAIESAVAQVHRPAQIIVVDDGSTDASADSVTEYAQRHPDRGIQLIRQENQGESAARNTGINAATCEWVAQLDADDWWEPDKLQEQIAMTTGSCVLVHTGQITHHADGRLEAAPLEPSGRRVGWCTRELVEPDSIAHSSILVRREALERIGGYDQDLVHAVDIDVYFKLSVLGTFAFVPRHLIHYRVHDGQTSWNYRIDQVCHQYQVVRRFFDDRTELADQVGRDYIDEQLTRLLELKLESFWWQRRLEEFRKLLAFADEHTPDRERISQWHRRARYPNWLIRLKDHLAGAGSRG